MIEIIPFNHTLSQLILFNIIIPIIIHEFAAKKRFRSLTEIEKYHTSEIRIPLFDKESADFCFEKSCEILSKPLNLSNQSASAMSMNKNNNININNRSTYEGRMSISQQTRDFIGENLIDIENTLKALNLDFLQTFTELEKNDSAETLFGESCAYESNINPKIMNTRLKLTKFAPSYGGDTSPKSIRSAQFSPLDKQMAQQTFNGLQYLNDSCSNEKLLEGKRSSTPDTGFASRETTNSSRRGSQKSSYSPQDTHFSPVDFNCSSQQSQMSGVDSRSPYAHSGIKGGFPRQRSMSFTEDYDLKSPDLSESQENKMISSIGAEGISNGNGHSQSTILRNRNRNSMSYKPKSIRARNLRRLSYNPISLESSSSSSEPDFDHSIAHSECDIRTRMYSSTRNRNSLKRKSQNYSLNPFVRESDKLYGSNASIRSAPQYNNYASDRQLNNYLDKKFGIGQYEFDTDIYREFIRSERRSLNNRTRRAQSKQFEAPPVAPPPSANSVHIQSPRIFDFGLQASSHMSLYAQFDVSKLTGKSPTTHSISQEVFPPELAKGQSSLPGVTAKSPVGNVAKIQGKTTQGGSAFHWPEKIHGSTVKQNEMLWRQSVRTQSPRGKKLNLSQSMSQAHNSDSSSTETDFNPRRPPSPAP